MVIFGFSIGIRGIYAVVNGKKPVRFAGTMDQVDHANTPALTHGLPHCIGVSPDQFCGSSVCLGHYHQGANRTRENLGSVVMLISTDFERCVAHAEDSRSPHHG
jgi:hypothetical protein